MRQVALIELPSTKADIILTFLSMLNLFMIILYLNAQALSGVNRLINDLFNEHTLHYSQTTIDKYSDII